MSYWQINVEGNNSKYKKGREYFSTATDRRPLDKLLESYEFPSDNGNNSLLYKFIFPIAECIAISHKLYRLGYRASTFFPGYQGVDRELKEDFEQRTLSYKMQIL